MERASKLLGGIKISGEAISAEELALAAWQAAVGKKIAVHAHAARMVRACLIVEVEDETWRRQLWALRGQILRNLARAIGQGHVEDVEFRVVPRRREPQRAAAVTARTLPLSDDEAERIGDPGLRRIYRATRTKALA